MIKKGLSRLGTFFLYLLSLLPFWFLYIIADIVFVILYYITGYRRRVVQENLRNSFPEKSAQERASIEKKYFKYMADLMMETIKSVSMSRRSVEKRMVCTNPEMVQHYFSQGKSILAAAGHYCNWEMACLSFGFLTNEKRMIVYKPQSNEIFTDFFNRTRARFGATMISMKQTLRKMIEFKNVLTFTVLASDQTPTAHEAQYFTTFLNQPTAVFLGIEKLTKVVNSVVIFYRIDLVKRGYYTYTFVPLAEEPEKTQPYEITEMHVKYLEGLIREKPEYWLWSHRRWKVKPPEGMKVH
ncbi:MAG: lysophospholipid acyltransferase family protein [Mucilaginibacter sp.]|uniref:lysophospholipid acyltransferase family protein n=1 Tax=Mucilaginibacter sp. L3T2-6 TaxID=3062491 RepID=UPI002676017D|nr:lysophospholipid acyltransferase family protein [Mucilaginibacter sp. L3T2-6]MDO3643099.1 lysophospholipid acyltransferase family protein [Mucilaginibacter sp. L3T2-6]MDV6215866.1 lysophospholipid acyltransferase family protein [Mucilaginibacter sp. L3T2-6]